MLRSFNVDPEDGGVVEVADGAGGLAQGSMSPAQDS